jgi:hypothetical protein
MWIFRIFPSSNYDQISGLTSVLLLTAVVEQRQLDSVFIYPGHLSIELWGEDSGRGIELSIFGVVLMLINFE